MRTYTPLYLPIFSSPLQVSYAPSSPLSPVSPASPSPLFSSKFAPYSPYLSGNNPHSPAPPPPIPPPWSWSCHHCHSTFPLGATRRCLHDGHYFCSGGTKINKSTGKLKRHNACGSVFDYVGWRQWGEWRRNVKNSQMTFEGASRGIYEDDGCAGECDFPSECRWAARLICPPRVDTNPAIVDSEKEPPSPGSPDSPKSPVSPAEMAEPDEQPPSPSTEGGSYLEKLIQSAERRLGPSSEMDKDLPLTPKEGRSYLEKLLLSTERHRSVIETAEKTGDRSSGLTLNFPVIDFASFKATMDKAHGVFFPGMRGRGESLKMEDFAPEDDAEMADVDLLAPRENDGTTSEPWNLRAQAPEGSLPLSPRRNAWDWSIGGGPEMMESES